MSPSILSVYIKKNTIVQLINNTSWCGRAYPNMLENGYFVFWIENNSSQFQTTYCTTCGNYIVSGVPNIIPKIKCNCR